MTLNFNLGIGTKIILGYLVVIILAGVSGAYSLRTLDQSRDKDEVITKGYYPLISTLNALDQVVQSTRTLSINWLYLPNAQDKSDLIELKTKRYPTLKRNLISQLSSLKRSRKDIMALLEPYEGTIPHQEVLMKKLDDEEAYNDELLLFELIQTLDNSIVEPLEVLHEKIIVETEELKKERDLLIQKKYSSFDSVEFVIISMTLAAVFLGICTAWVITRNIVNLLGTQPSEVAILADKVARGKLNLDFNKKKYRGLYANMKSMIEKLQSIVREVHSKAFSMAEVSNEMASIAQNVSSGASNQASSSEEISASMEEMTSNISQNSDNSQAAEKTSTQTMENMQEGQKVMDETVSSLKTITERISVISEIARQTDILALNAAVEAARAGAAGKGFSVVASEVRKLAENSRLVSDEIEELCQINMEVAEKTRSIFEESLGRIEDTVELVQKIANASVEQKSGAQQISDAIQFLNRITQENAVNSDKMASQSNLLLEQSDELKVVVDFFTA